MKLSPDSCLIRKMPHSYTYLVFTQHKENALDPSSTGVIKGMANNEDSAISLLKQILETEYQLDKAPIHGVIIRYLNGCLREAIWTIDSLGYETTNHLVGGFEIDENGLVEKEINIYDLNKNVVEERPTCLMM